MSSILMGVVLGLREGETEDFSLEPTSTEIEEILSGIIGESIKTKIADYLAMLPASGELLRERFDRLKELLPRFIDFLKEMSSEDFVNTLEKQLGSTLSSNYSFAMETSAAILTAGFAAIQKMPPNLPSEIPSLRTTISEFLESLPPGDKLPNPLEYLDDSHLGKALADLASAFNNSALVMLTITIWGAVKHEMSLNKRQITELERLTRDWTQEVLAQNELRMSKQFPPVVSVRVRMDFSSDNND
ncbi:MAG: hypothetical protein ACTSPE_09285 [Candidatus Thorarchaeota archaeon]